MIKKRIKKIRDFFLKKRDSLFGKENYDKFIIITRSRTGSNLLMSLLDSHPNVIAKGELFESLKGRTCKDVWNEIYDKKPKHIQYFGFKIFYYHPIDSDDKEVWNYIKNDESIKLIHLTRKNMLRTVVSRQIAEKTNRWSNVDNKKIQITEKMVEIDINYCLNEFKLTKDYENKIRSEFKREFYMELTYEDLVKDKQEMMTRIFNFLGIENTVAKSRTIKQNSEKLEDLILNYSELKEALEESEWSYLLDLN